ncbi:hypothetical protein GCM10010508_16460 [Streptomyces naganishii JCM 4654]|uniref:Uncharacterized protein n=1 Tax=Streptomyces naganishii JCM 4654 TaxID=1306179 RepID=A0A918Y1I7_9ACTN|nr:hypothetical protein GCM10010508_16460 [Streptomyces naganishii JCM 4654]
MTIQVHDSPPAPQAGTGWEPAEELSLRADDPTLCLATIGQGDFWDTWPDEESIGADRRRGRPLAAGQLRRASA